MLDSAAWLDSVHAGRRPAPQERVRTSLTCAQHLRLQYIRRGGPLRVLLLVLHRTDGISKLTLSVGEVAAYLGVSVSTLFGWRTRDLWPARVY